jgi:hypothetical protein
MSDMRDYVTLYGIYTDDWITSFGGNTFNRHLVKDYIAGAGGTGAYCSCTSSSVWIKGGREFIYPQNIKKIYFLEGVIQGEVLFESYLASKCSDYRVTIFKLNTDTTKTDLATTGVITLLPTGDSYASYDGMFYHWWIDLTEHKEITEDDRIGLRVEWNVSHTSTVTANLVHDNDSSSATGLNLWVEIPLLLGQE